MTDKAICKDGADEEANVDYKDHIAKSAEQASCKDPDVEEDDRGADECDGGDPKEWTDELSLAMGLSGERSEGKWNMLPFGKTGLLSLYLLDSVL